MPPAPRDVVDLRLAPVALALDERLEVLSRLDATELATRVTLETNKEPRSAPERAEALLESVGHLLDLGGWELAWHARGLQMRHGAHRLVLGVPESMRAYLA